jgi:hypothetical protein
MHMFLLISLTCIFLGDIGLFLVGNYLFLAPSHTCSVVDSTLENLEGMNLFPWLISTHMWGLLELFEVYSWKHLPIGEYDPTQVQPRRRHRFRLL